MLKNGKARGGRERSKTRRSEDVEGDPRRWGVRAWRQAQDREERRSIALPARALHGL